MNVFFFWEWKFLSLGIYLSWWNISLHGLVRFVADTPPSPPLLYFFDFQKLYMRRNNTKKWLIHIPFHFQTIGERRGYVWWNEVMKHFSSPCCMRKFWDDVFLVRLLWYSSSMMFTFYRAHQLYLPSRQTHFDLFRQVLRIWLWGVNFKKCFRFVLTNRLWGRGQ